MDHPDLTVSYFIENSVNPSIIITGPPIAVCNMSGCRYVSECTADPMVPSLIPVWFHTAILLPSTDSRRVVVSFKQKYLHEVLVNCLVKVKKCGKVN